MIIIAGLVLIMLIVWGIRVTVRRARKKARARAEIRRTRAAALATQSRQADEQRDGRSPADCAAG